MTLLPYSEELYQLFRRVNDGFVVHHGCCDVHAPGFSFRGADMTESFQDLCNDAYRDRFFHIGLHSLDGSQVSLTEAGEGRMEELQRRHDESVRGVA